MKLRPKVKPLIETGREIPKAWSDEEIEKICQESQADGASLTAVAKKYGVLPAKVMEWLDERRECVEYAKQEIEWNLIESIKNDLKSITDSTSSIEANIAAVLEEKSSSKDKTILKDYIDLTKLRLQRLDVLTKLAEKAKLNFDFLHQQVKQEIKEQVESTVVQEEIVPVGSDEQKRSERILKLISERGKNVGST